jgi:hypothetical protein
VNPYDTDYTADPRSKKVTTRRESAGNYQILYEFRLAGWLYQDFMTPNDPWRFRASTDVPLGWSATRQTYTTKRDAMEYITASILFAEDAMLERRKRIAEEQANEAR